MKIETEEIFCKILEQKGVKLFVKRIDQIHKFVSGNKWYKLKYNFIEAKRKDSRLILTFGGAYSNHILATAYLAKKEGFRSIGVIRGQEVLPLNPTLCVAKENGMDLYYVSRSDYRLKDEVDFLNKLKIQFGDFYLIPEGGTNKFAIKGASEILDFKDTQDYICCAVGTGGTIAGVINSKRNNQRVVGFPVIKGDGSLQSNVKSFTKKGGFVFINDYIFGGYAKLTNELVCFIGDFYKAHNIQLDVVYTGKMMFGIMDLVSKDYFPRGSTILAIHTGGLQGNKGMNERFNIQLPVY